MKIKKSINTEIEINTAQDLPKLKTFIEANSLDKPNFSAIARELNIDRRTVKKYYNGYEKKERKKKKLKLTTFMKSFRNCFRQSLTKYFITNPIFIGIW